MLLLLISLACRSKDLTYDTGLVDEDGDGIAADADCDDGDPDVAPGADELCNGVDDDCDGAVDEGAVDASSWYLDGDGDGYGVGGATVSCEPLSGQVEADGDCDDGDPQIHPGAEETDCTDPVDYNCDGSVGYADADGDGYAACEECDDAERTVNPSATEVCDGIDNDCDGSSDLDAVDGETWYADTDGDGYGDASNTLDACDQPEGHVADDADCDDGDAGVSPGAEEVCDGVDQDCDGTADEEATDRTTWYADADGDGYGNPDFGVDACDQPSAYVADATDCDDGEPLAWTGASEACDAVDNDCDGGIDEGVTSTFYLDYDGDGYGDEASTAEACSAPSLYVAVGGDCDDTDSSYSPAASEGCDGEDYDCDGDVDNDGDGDGYADSSCGGADCDDGDSSVSPAATEVCDDGVDNDCDGGSNTCGLDGTLSLSTGDAIFQGGSAGDRLGGYGVTSGDVNGDGYSDVALGASRADDGGTDAGALYLFYGPVSGTPAISSADATVLGASTGDRAARSLAVADVDGDGNDDLLMVSSHDDDGGSNSGSAFLLLGPLTGSSTTATYDARFVAEEADDSMGDVAPTEDIDGDSLPDFLIAAQYNDRGGSKAGAVYVVSGATTGTLDLSSAHAILVGEDSGDEAGSALGAAGDTDGDGTPDVLVGARFTDGGGTDAGSAYLLLGPVSGTVDLSASDTVLEGKDAGDYVGGDLSVTGVGDLDGDGYDDLVVGAGSDDNNGQDAGAIGIWLGPLSSGTRTVLSADARILGESAGDRAGRSVAPLGDVDGDGHPDLLVSAQSEDSGGTDAGAAYLVLGPATGISTLGDAKAKFTGTGAGDATSHHSLSSAGDVDGDGYGDLLVGAALNDDNGTDAGQVVLFLGGGL